MKRNVEELENLILSHWTAAKKKRANEKLEEYLSERQSKMNENFEWTPENIDKLLALNNKLTTCFEKLVKEATPIFKALQKRLDEKDAFLHDFEIEAKIKPFILVPDEDGTLCEPDSGIELILMENLPEHILNINLKSDIIEDRLTDNIHFSKKLNWNNSRLFGGNFDDHYICYAIHELCDHTFWSFSDILKINHLWSEVKVLFQNFEDVYINCRFTDISNY